MQMALRETRRNFAAVKSVAFAVGSTNGVWLLARGRGSVGCAGGGFCVVVVGAQLSAEIAMPA
jgi:hypothetical protein